MGGETVKLERSVKTILGLIGFVLVVAGFLWCYTNPNVWAETYRVISDGEYVYVVDLDVPVHAGDYGITTVEISYVNYWNQNGFVIMAVGLATILLGLILGEENYTLKRIRLPFSSYDRTED